MKYTIFKKLSAFALVLMLILTITACNSNPKYNTKVPYGNISNAVYAQYDTIKLTQKQLYDDMRINATSTLTEQIKNILIKDEIDKINLNNETDRKELIEYINNATFSTIEQDEIDVLSATDYNVKVQKFVDSMALAGVSVNSSDIYADHVLEFYIPSLAQKRYTRAIIEDNTDYEYIDEDEDELNPYYISEKAIEARYKSSYKDNGAYKVIIANFPTLIQAEDALNTVLANLGETEINDNNIEAVIIALYNIAFSYKTSLTSIADVAAVKDEDLSAHNSSLISFIKKLEAGQYTKTPKRYNNWCFIYKIADAEEIELTDDLKEEIRQELIDEMLTQFYIDEEMKKAIYDAEIIIYDPLLAVLFEAKYPDFKRSKKFDNQLVAKVNETEIKVDDFFLDLEKLYATGTVIDYFIIEQLLKSDYMSKITADENKEFKKDYNNVISEFKKGNYESEGYPKMMGVELFKFAYFRATKEKDILDRYYRTQKASQYLLEDYNQTYFTNLEKISNNYYTSFFSLNVKHVLLSVDYDLDGTLDTPEEFKRKLSAAQVLEFEQAIIDIMAMVYTEAEYLESSIADSLTFIMEQYNSNGIIFSQKETNPGMTWKDLKKFNISMKVEDLGTVNNSNSSSYVKPFSKAVYDLYQEILLNEDLDFEDEYLPEITTSSSIDELCQTTFGYHLIMAKSGEEITSAKFTIDDDRYQSSGDTHKTYERIVVEYDGVEYILDGYSSNIWASENQLKVYVYESLTDKGIQNLPNDVKTYISNFYSNFNTRYTNSTFKNYLMIKYANILDITYANPDMSAKMLTDVQVIKNQVDSYAAYDIFIPSVYSSTFNWWSIY